MAALRYVDLNPVRARLVVEAVSYEWSSGAAHVSGKDPTGLLDQEAWRELCPLNDWGEVLAASPDEQHAERVRQATRTGRPLGVLVLCPCPFICPGFNCEMLDRRFCPHR